MHLVERQHGLLFDEALAQLELGAGEMDDVVLFEQAVALDPLAIDEGSVGAVFIDQPELAGDVTNQDGVQAAQPEVGDDQIAFLAAPHATRQACNHEIDAGPIRIDGFQSPLLVQCIPRSKRC